MWMLHIAIAGANPCDVPVDIDAWRWQLARADEQLEQKTNLPGALATLDSVKDRTRCLATRIDPADVTRLARLQAVGAYHRQEMSRVEEWAKLAAASAPATPLPAWLTDKHPVYKHLERPPPDWSRLDDVTIAAPRKGAVFLNGVWLDQAMFPATTTNLVQVLDKKGRSVDAWWQHGAAVPGEVLKRAGAAPVRPKFYPVGPAVSDVLR